MYLKIISYFLIVPVLFAVQASLIDGLPEMFRFNLAIVTVIVVLLALGREEAMWSSIGFGFLYDLYAIDYFGVNIIIFAAMVFFANLLLVKFFTNKSLYSFAALVLFGSLFYNGFIWIAYFVGRTLFNGGSAVSFDLYYLINRIFLNLLAACIAFYIINYLSNRFRPVFLLKSQKL